MQKTTKSSELKRLTGTDEIWIVTEMAVLRQK